MARSLHFATSAILGAARLAPAWLVDMEFVQLWTGARDIEYGGKTYLGNGWLRPIQSVQEGPELSASSIEIALAGAPDQLVALALTNANRNRSVTVSLAVVEPGGSIIGEPYTTFYGKFDTAEIVDSGDDSTVVFVYESPLARLGQPKGSRYSDVDQKILFEKDRGFEFISSLANWSGTWLTVEK